MILFLFTNLGWAQDDIPKSAWKAAEIEHRQQYVYDAEKVQIFLNDACSLGHKSSCTWERKGKRAQDASQRKAYFAELCEKEDPWGCVISGWYDSQLDNVPGIPHPRATNWDEAYRKFERACTLGESRGCVEMGKIDLGNSNAGIRAQGLRQIEQACTLGDSEGCFVFGTMLAEGTLLPLNVTRALELFHQECEQSNAKACAQEAMIVMGQAQNFEEAKQSFDLYEQGCHLGSTDACSWLGQMYEEGMGTNPNVDLAVLYYEKSCENFHPESCDKLGLLYSKGKGVQSNLKKAEDLFVQSCEAANPFACYNLAAFYDENGLEEPDAIAALLQKSCALGSGRGCLTTGVWFEQGKIGKGSVSDALRYYDLGCGLDYEQSCLNAAVLSYRSKQYANASQYYDKGCTLGNTGACASLGLLYELGEGVLQNLDMARSLYQFACHDGDTKACERYEVLNQGVNKLIAECQGRKPSSCYEAAQHLEKGKTIPSNLVKAYNLVELGCAKKQYKSCSKQAYYLWEGMGVDQDEKKAFDLFQNSCVSNEATGCHSIGLMYSEGRYVEQDLDRALAYFRKSCDLKNGNSCYMGSFLMRQLYPPNLQDAIELAHKGCSFEHADSCAQEAFIYTQSPRVNLPLAAQLFRENCTRYHANSCFNYGVMLNKGQGVTADPQEAARLIDVACVLGDAQACQVIQEQ